MGAGLDDLDDSDLSDSEEEDEGKPGGETEKAVVAQAV